jgi:mannose-1-phosphate guanylyltransferase
MEYSRSFTAFLPCAGLGTRLRPMTNYWPKPLIPVFGIPLFDLSFRQILAYRPESCRINTHYLAEKMADHAHQRWSREIQIDHEDKKILGTGGCLGRIKHEITTDDILVYNGDVLTDFDISAGLHAHQSVGADVTLIVLPESLPGENSIYVSGGWVEGIGPTANCPRGAQPHGFTGIHILSQKMLNLLPDVGDYSIIPHYIDAIASGLRVQAYTHKGLWFDLGTPERYYRTHRRLLELWNAGHDSLRDVFQELDPQFERSLEFSGDTPRFVSPEAKLSPSSLVSGFSVILRNATIASAGNIDESIVLGETKHPCSGNIRRKIVGFDWAMEF